MSYLGSKGRAGVFQRIIGNMPPHSVYVEPFLGSGKILLTKLPAPVLNVGIDAKLDNMTELRRNFILDLVHQRHGGRYGPAASAENGAPRCN